MGCVSPLIYLIAGEASGDVLGARLMAAIAAQMPKARYAGVGGPLMAGYGLKSLFPMQELALMGLFEVLPRVHHINRRLRETIADIGAKRPAVVVTIDSPSFTLRVLKAIQRMGIPRAHYVAPQAWAWREGRVRHFPGRWEMLLCLLPFEPPFFARHGLPAQFVGHPVLESGADQADGRRFRSRHAISPESHVITVMPGSRRTETRRLLPIFGETLHRLIARVPRIVAAVPTAGPVTGAVEQATRSWPVRTIIVTRPEEKFDAYAASQAALVKSGTSTLELALAQVPMTVAYRFNPVTAALARRLVKVRYASILNLLADKEIVPEFIQQRCSPQHLCRMLTTLLTDERAAEAQRTAFPAVLDLLRAPQGKPSMAAAVAVLNLLDQA
ncbi:MAG: lipid-A-disaccharide synthase [Acetobacteraceae bacterium]|nr:lipid-A-disaccharide synthase [Acetobacteraceae bacterium]